MLGQLARIIAYLEKFLIVYNRRIVPNRSDVSDIDRYDDIFHALRRMVVGQSLGAGHIHHKNFTIPADGRLVHPIHAFLPEKPIPRRPAERIVPGRLVPCKGLGGAKISDRNRSPQYADHRDKHKNPPLDPRLPGALRRKPLGLQSLLENRAVAAGRAETAFVFRTTLCTCTHFPTFFCSASWFHYNKFYAYCKVILNKKQARCTIPSILIPTPPFGPQG